MQKVAGQCNVMCMTYIFSGSLCDNVHSRQVVLKKKKSESTVIQWSYKTAKIAMYMYD